MNNKTENPVYSHNTLEFVTVSAEFCAYLEQLEGTGRSEFIATMQKLLPLLYLKAQMLPQVESEGAFLPDDQVTEADYNYILNGVYEIMKETDEYEDFVYDEAMQTEESQWKTVSEGLADIYQALRNFVSAYQQRVEDCMLDALWCVRDNFELYWGQNLVDTLKQLHKIRYVLNSGSDEEDLQ